MLGFNTFKYCPTNRFEIVVFIMVDFFLLKDRMKGLNTSIIIGASLTTKGMYHLLFLILTFETLNPPNPFGQSHTSLVK